MNDEPRRLLPEDLLLPRDTRRSLPIALLRAREAVMSRFRPMLNAPDVTEQQWRVIRILGEAGEPLEATDLADRACVLAPSLTRITKTLENRGLITRQRHGTDGRRVLLEISPTGIALIRSVTPESAKIYVELEARFGRERLAQLLDLLEILTRNSGQ